MKKRMKILITGNLDKDFYNQKELVPALSRIKKFDIKHIGFFGYRRFEDFQKKLKLSGNIFNYFDRKDIREINWILYENIMKYEFDVLILKGIMLYHTFLLPETIERFREKGKFVVCEFGDNELNFDLNKFWLPCFDLCVSFTRKESLEYNKLFKNVITRFSGANIMNRKIENISEKEKKHDALFIGTPYSPRPEILEFLINNGIDVTIFGSKKWAEYEKIRPFYRGYISNEKYDEEIKKAKILLGLMEWKDGKPHLNSKLFDAAKTKSFTISTYYKPFFEDYRFEEGKNIVSYKDLNELLRKINYYLDRPEERQKIANDLYSKVKNECNLINRFNTEFEEIESKLRNGYFKKLPKNTNLTIIYPAKNRKDVKKIENIEQIFITGKKKNTSESQNIFHIENFKQNYDKVVKTDYLIMGNKNIEYNSFLGKYIHFIAKNFDPEMAIFNVASTKINYRNHRKRFIYDINSIIWKKYAFKRQILKKLFSQRLIFDFKSSAIRIPIYFAWSNESKKYIILDRFFSILRKAESLWRRIKK